MFVVLGSAEKFQLSMEANHQNYIYIYLSFNSCFKSMVIVDLNF